MRIGIDIDDTLTNTIELQKSFWQEYHHNHPNDDYTDEIPKNINTFGFKYIEDYWDIYREELFYPEFKENASLITNKLKKDGHELCVITSRPDYKYKDLHKRLEKWFKDIAQIEEANKYHVKCIMFNNIESYKGLKTTSWLELYDIIKKGF